MSDATTNNFYSSGKKISLAFPILFDNPLDRDAFKQHFDTASRNLTQYFDSDNTDWKKYSSIYIPLRYFGSEGKERHASPFAVVGKNLTYSVDAGNSSFKFNVEVNRLIEPHELRPLNKEAALVVSQQRRYFDAMKTLKSEILREFLTHVRHCSTSVVLTRDNTFRKLSVQINVTEQFLTAAIQRLKEAATTKKKKSLW